MLPRSTGSRTLWVAVNAMDLVQRLATLGTVLSWKMPVVLVAVIAHVEAMLEVIEVRTAVAPGTSLNPKLLLTWRASMGSPCSSG